MQLDGRVAVVTGGGAETGRAIALRLAAGGALVVVADRDLAAAEGTVAAIEQQSGHAAAIAADVTDDADVRRMIDFAGRDGGGPHVLVNNAGGWGEANYLEATPEQWSATLSLNLRAPMLATHLALEPMRAAGGGVVVNIASTAGIATDAYASPEYGAAKAGLVRFTTALGDLRERMNVRVNCIVPDWIATDRARGELAQMTAAERKQAGPLVPMADVAAAVIAFVSDDELAGRVVLVRGGRPRRFLT
ncbi:MAG TPA: SDR family NAD(P)-dependent oxidoreductase [Solirubrobacteraceae bacterium]|nr:SDR family NAD(P)-dependent oxidoreductase [Solirubrobacteraceae bacterium]